ncbi:MAG: 4Fe-4S dicluster domain-containing protein [Thaumarchaeota archaeon]|nr:4Fe-4S dicluster domain-containing protein [Nitrososphaerota archaeon]
MALETVTEKPPAHEASNPDRLLKTILEDSSKCTHCGFCLAVCPTYELLRVEPHSPRGRIYLAKALAEGRLEPTASVRDYLYGCVMCRACELACPSGVHYGEIQEVARDYIEKHVKRPLMERLMRWGMFNVMFHGPRLFRLSFRLLRFYQRSPRLQKFIDKLGILRKVPYEPAKWLFAYPPIPDKFFTKSGYFKAYGESKYKVGMFKGCVMTTLFAHMNEATLEILRLNNCDVIIPEGQWCCGAFHTHNGYREVAKAFAKRNIDAFWPYIKELDAIVANASGCGTLLKEYGELLRDDPEYAEKAKVFSSKVKDFTEWLADIGLPNRNMGRVEMKVTLQDTCHLVNVQKISHAPRFLLKAIPGLEFVEMKDPAKCCGSGGNYYMFNYDISKWMLDRKIKYASDTGADALVTVNAPCYIQLRLGLLTNKSKMKLLHIIELLDMAYKKAKKGG